MLIRSATPDDHSEIETLLDAVFGPKRHRRTASLLRAGSMPIAGPSIIARDGDDLLGSVQYWPIELVAGGTIIPLTLLGPVAIAASTRNLGLGRRLIASSLTIAYAAGLDPIMLIGDLSYYGRFGFDASATAGWSLPGPFEAARLLLRSTGIRPLPSVATVRRSDDSLPAMRVAILSA